MGCSFQKKSITITNTFPKFLNESNRKSNKRCVDKGSTFYNRSMKSWLQDNDIKMYLTHSKRKSVVAERSITAIKNKIYKYMTLVSKNMYIDKLDDIVNKCNNTYRTTTKMKLVDEKSITYVNFNEENNNEDPKLKVVDHVRKSKYRNIFAKGQVLKWSDEDFVIKKDKNTVPWTYVHDIVILAVKKFWERFAKKYRQK